MLMYRLMAYGGAHILCILKHFPYYNDINLHHIITHKNPMFKHKPQVKDIL